MRRSKRLEDSAARLDAVYEARRQKRQKHNSPPQVASQAAVDKAAALVESRGAAATNQKVKHDA
jgi:hypothetical protein